MRLWLNDPPKMVHRSTSEGITIMDDIHYIERGYEDFHLKLQALGAQIEVVNSERDLQKFKLKVC